MGLVIMTLMRFGVPGSVTRFYYDHKDNPEELNDYVTTIHRFLIGSTLVMGLALGILFFFFSSVLTPGILFFPFIVIVLINSGFSANSDLQRRLLQSTEQSRYSAILSIVTAFLGIVTAIVFVVGFKLGAMGILISQLITTFIFFIQAQYFLKKYLVGTFKRSMLGASLKYGANTLPHLLFVLAAPFLSKIILMHTNSLMAVGIYSLANRFVQPLQLIYTAFNQSYMPIYYSLRKDGIKTSQLKSYSRLIWVASCIMFMGLLFIIPPLIPMLTPERFHHSGVLVPILATGFIWQITYYITVIDLFYTKKNKYVSYITLGGLVVNLTVTIMFVNAYAAEALAWAQLMGFFAWALLAKYLVDKHGEIKILKGLIWQTMLVCIVTLGLDRFVLTSDMLWMRIIAFLAISFLIVYLFVIRNKNLLQILKNLKLFNTQKNEAEQA